MGAKNVPGIVGSGSRHNTPDLLTKSIMGEITSGNCVLFLLKFHSSS